RTIKESCFWTRWFLWRRFATSGDSRVHYSLSPRTKSPRTRKPADHSYKDDCLHCRSYPEAAKAWRTAQLLLQGGGINVQRRAAVTLYYSAFRAIAGVWKTALIVPVKRDLNMTT